MQNDQQNISKVALPFIVVVTLVLGVALGFFVGNISSSSSTQIAASSSSIAGVETSTFIDEEYLNKVYDIIQKNYIGEVPNKTDLTYGVIKGLVTSLGNQYNSFLNPKEAADYLDSRDPNVEGIGVTLRYDGQNSAIETALQNYPAEKAGLRAGDIIVQVNGEKVLGLYPNVVASKIRGQSGTTVQVQVARTSSDGNQSLLDFSIVREKIQIDNISMTDLGNGIFKINVTQFLDTSVDKFNSNWDKIVVEILAKNSNPKGIIVDLRNNPGGYVFAVRHALEEFLKKDMVVMGEEEKNADKTIYRVQRNGKLTEVPLVVLVNEGSASASEIFASGIQDNDRGEIVGVATVGKGVEQEVLTMDDNSLLILVFQKWLTPSGRQISKDDPIHPDLVVEITEDDYNKGNDPQLNKAEELLK